MSEALKLYNTYKSLYMSLKGQMIVMRGGGVSVDEIDKTAKVVFIAGIPGVGKSTVAKKIADSGYILISTDQIIYDRIIPLFQDEIKNEFDGRESAMFGVYHPNKYHPVIKRARRKLIKVVRKMIDNNVRSDSKVVIEGTLLNKELIRGILGSNDRFVMYFIKPVSKEEYKKRVVKRFVEDPDNYGRMGRLRSIDKSGEGLADYRANGIEGEIISGMIDKVMELKYKKISEWVKHYTDWGLEIRYLIN